MKFVPKTKAYLSNFLQAQLIVTIAAIPILVNWGLSISLMTFIGNLLFSPILTIFLMLSSLVFFTQLLHLPNAWLVAIMDWFTQTWAHILAYGCPSWLIEFCRPPTVLLFIIPVVTIVTLQIGKFKNAGTRIGVMSGILGISLLGLWGWAYLDHPAPLPGDTPTTIHLTPTGELPQPNNAPCPMTTDTPSIDQGSMTQQTPDTTKASKNKRFDPKNQLLDISREVDGSLSITDHGFFNRRPSPEKTVEFELKPYLVKHFGQVRLHHLTIERPGQRALTAAKAMCTLFQVTSVTVPYFKKSLTKGGWRAFFELKRLLEEKKICFNRT